MVTLALGGAAACSDGYRCEVQAVVLDPAAGAVTHLVVEPAGRSGLARLVPLDLVVLDQPGGAADEVSLRCTEAEFRGLAAAEETLAEFTLGYEVPVQLLPPGWRGAGGPVTEGGAIPRIPEKASVDLIPPGEAEERRGAPVRATDGDAGQLRAVRIDPATGRLTHVLVREGHLLTRKDVAVPAGRIAGFDDGIQLSITRQQVRDLPPADAG